MEVLIFTNCKELKKFKDTEIKFIFFNNIDEINHLLKRVTFPLILLNTHFKELNKICVPYSERNYFYELVIINLSNSQNINHLINNDIFGVLNKSILQVDIHALIERYNYRRKLFSSNKSNQLFKISENRYILIHHLRFFRAYGNYTLIFTLKERLIERTTLTEVLSRLPKNLFIQTHRSYIINVAQVSEIKNRSVKMGSDTIPISNRKKINILNLMEKEKMII